MKGIHGLKIELADERIEVVSWKSELADRDLLIPAGRESRPGVREGLRRAWEKVLIQAND